MFPKLNVGRLKALHCTFYVLQLNRAAQVRVQPTAPRSQVPPLTPLGHSLPSIAMPPLRCTTRRVREARHSRWSPVRSTCSAALPEDETLAAAASAAPYQPPACPPTCPNQGTPGRLLCLRRCWTRRRTQILGRGSAMLAEGMPTFNRCDPGPFRPAHDGGLCPPSHHPSHHDRTLL